MLGRHAIRQDAHPGEAHTRTAGQISGAGPPRHQFCGCGQPGGAPAVRRSQTASWEKALRALLIVSAAALAGCASPGIVQISPDTYMLSRADRGGIFRNSSAMKADVINEANAFAAAQGKVAVPLFLTEKPLVPATRLASVEYQFRIVDKNDPEARRVSLVPRPDVVIDKTERVAVDTNSKNTTEKAKDVHAELLKLDDLRKRGIVTEVEFEVQKRKLLAAN